MAGVLDRYHEERMKDPQFRLSVLIERFIADLHIEMKLKNVNQKQLAERLGLSEVAVSKFLNFDSNKNPKLETLLKYAEALGVTVHLRAGDLENKKQFNLWNGEIHFRKNNYTDIARKKEETITTSNEMKKVSSDSYQLAS
jgi:transcriptional regulator with XRE-family HTH domain